MKSQEEGDILDRPRILGAQGIDFPHPGLQEINPLMSISLMKRSPRIWTTVESEVVQREDYMGTTIQYLVKPEISFERHWSSQNEK